MIKNAAVNKPHGFSFHNEVRIINDAIKNKTNIKSSPKKFILKPIFIIANKFKKRITSNKKYFPPIIKVVNTKQYIKISILK